LLPPCPPPRLALPSLPRTSWRHQHPRSRQTRSRLQHLQQASLTTSHHHLPTWRCLLPWGRPPPPPPRLHQETAPHCPSGLQPQEAFGRRIPPPCVGVGTAWLQTCRCIELLGCQRQLS
ncbi:unnamed protein product, partial [Ectocarpus sp. 12 AP-2014]